MKKYIIPAFAAVIAFAAVFSCAKEEITASGEKGEQITINASISAGLTKVVFAPSYTDNKPSGLALTWKASDKLRVADHANPSTYVDIDLFSGAGGKDAVFTGTAPVGAASYDVSIVNGDVAANQEADGTTTHLQYLASKTGITDLTNISFDTFNSILAITAKMPSSEDAAKIKSVDITASANIFNGGNTLNITLTSIGDAGGDGILHFYATLPQGDQAIEAGTSLLVKFNAPGETQNVYTRYIELPATSFTSSKLNTININAVNSASYANASSTDIGKSTNPYLIGDKYQMAKISVELSTTEKTYFKMVDDIALSSWSSIDCNSKGAIDLDGNNKTITGLNAPLFSFFDGQASNLTLSNAVISAGGNYYGVFARTVDEGKSCELTGIAVSGSVTAGSLLGGLIGRIETASSCSLTNCSANVNVTGAGSYIGGLVGQIKKGTITYCSATGNVSSNDNHYAGGLVGQINGIVEISKSYASGSVNTGSKNRAGGLIGNIKASTATITDCYSTGAVTGSAYSGGFIGGVENDGSSFTVTRGYTNSTVAGAKWTCCVFCGTGSQYGTTTGFVGWNTSNRAAWCYNEQTVTSGNYMGTSGSVYSQAVALGGWDFTNVWTTDATPQLRSYVPAP